MTSPAKKRGVGRPRVLVSQKGKTISTRIALPLVARLEALRVERGYTIAEVIAAGVIALERKREQAENEQDR